MKNLQFVSCSFYLNQPRAEIESSTHGPGSSSLTQPCFKSF